MDKGPSSLRVISGLGHIRTTPSVSIVTSMVKILKIDANVWMLPLSAHLTLIRATRFLQPSMVHVLGAP